MKTTTRGTATRLFERQPRDRLVITDRDLDALSLLDELRLMNSHQMRNLFGEEFVRNRLKRLYHHGYIERIEAQRRVRLLKGGGSQPLILALANKGAALLKAHRHLVHTARDWNERNRALKPWSLRHPIAVADMAVAFSKIAREPSIASLTRVRERVSLLAPGRAAPLLPDLTVELVNDAGQKTLWFVEVDCGSEPNTRERSSELQSLRSKFEGYLAYTRSGLPAYQFGTKACRILTVVTGGKTKRDNVAKVADAVACGVGVDRFLIGTLAEVREASSADTVWRNAEGAIKSLL